MPSEEHPQWGPSVHEYLFTVEERLSSSFDKYVAKQEITVEASNDLIPISLLETTLAAGENMHIVGFQSGGQLFPKLISTLRGYVEVYKGGVFDYYYGFLCIRHIIRMICIATITEVEAFDEFLEDLDPDMTSNDVADLLADEALDIMADALYTGDLLNVADLFGCSYSKSGNAFVIDGGLNYNDVGFLTEVLWQGRKWIVELRREGLLPGLPALLFVLCEMTIFMKTPRHKKPWLHIQELLLRCYLGDTTYPERSLMRQLCRYVDTQIRASKLPDDYTPVDEDDAFEVIQAYIDLLSPPLELSLAPIMLLDISAFLLTYIYLLMTNGQKRMILEEMAPDVVRSALARLELEIDRECEGEMQAPRRGFTRDYAADVFGYTGVFEESIVSPKVRQKFSQMLFDADIHGLAGRVLLLVARETSEQPDTWEHFLSSFPRLQQAIHKLPPLPAPKLAVVTLEWRKVFAHILYLHTIPSQIPKECLGDTLEAWDMLRPPKVSRCLDMFECAYPRCAIQYAHARVPEARIACVCAKGLYCSVRCQQMHWTLSTADCHARECYLT